MSQQGFISPRTILILCILLVSTFGFLVLQATHNAEKSEVVQIMPTPTPLALAVKLKENKQRAQWRAWIADEFASYTPTSSSQRFVCYTMQDVPDTEDYRGIIIDIQKQNRDIYRFCRNDIQDKTLVVSYRNTKNAMEDLKVEIVSYFNREGYFNHGVEYLLTDVPSFSYFTLNKWYANGDVIFTLVTFPYHTETHLNQTEQDPYASKIIEYCNIDIAKGTSERLLNCLSFRESKTRNASNFLTPADMKAI